MITIIRLDLGVMWYLDKERETYTEVPIGGEDVFGEEMDTEEMGEIDDEAPFDVSDIKVTKTGKKREIAGYTCEGINVEMAFEAGMDQGTMPEKTNILFWMAPDKKELREMRTVLQRMLESSGEGEQGFPMKGAMAELSETMKDLEGIPLGMDIVVNLPMGSDEGQRAEMKEAMKMMREMMKGEGAEGEAEDEEDAASNTITIKREAISVSVEKLDDSLFETPEGWPKTRIDPTQMKMKP
jgi:hypothetical protein